MIEKASRVRGGYTLPWEEDMTMTTLTGKAVDRACGIVLVGLILVCCAGPKEEIEEQRVLPVAAELSMVRVGKTSSSDLSDGLPRETLVQAVRKSLAYYARLDPNRPVYFGKDRYTAKGMQRMLQQFLELLDENLDGKAKKNAMCERFSVYRGGGREKQVHFTGYYEPVLYGSRLPGIDFTAPIYRVPADLITVDLGLFQNNLKGTRIAGRYKEGTLVPYYTRHEIDRLGLLNGRGYELAWVKDPVEAFFLQIQGSGKIILPDRSVLNVHYPASNGRPYRGIGNLLVERGDIPADEKSLWALKRYLQSHPGEQASIMDYNERYVFFEVVPEGPLGSLDVRLTPGRSIAMDLDLYPQGALAYIETEVPVIGGDGRPVAWEQTRRFVLVQDTGGAIRGPSRGDIFWGDDEEAGTQAGWMNRPGKIYFFAPKPQ
jgi:membrane-bound lytic murein transglycosylase A